MQVVSGAPGRERIHFEAPPASRVPAEMKRFIAWFEDDAAAIDPVLTAAVAHLRFVTIHPFDDGNGRIGRAIADLALARSERTSQRCYSLSARLRIARADYYRMLETTQRGGLDITAWIVFFLDVLDAALADAETTLTATLQKASFWASHATVPLNPRQRDILNKLLDGFVGKLTSSTWAKLAKCSPDTALRDIDALLRHGVLAREAAGGRSTSYVLSEGGTPLSSIDPVLYGSKPS
jgi:Fic family protein